jgi:hypothetical protein
MTALATEHESATAIRSPRIADTGRHQLLTSAEGVGLMIDKSGRSVRRLDSAALMPRGVRVGGAVKWRIAEIEAWVAAGCPSRARWEAMQKP